MKKKGREEKGRTFRSVRAFDVGSVTNGARGGLRSRRISNLIRQLTDTTDSD